MRSDFEIGWKLGYEQGLRDEKNTVAALTKIHGVEAMIPALEENLSTATVAKQLRSILGLPPRKEN